MKGCDVSLVVGLRFDVLLVLHRIQSPAPVYVRQFLEQLGSLLISEQPLEVESVPDLRLRDAELQEWFAIYPVEMGNAVYGHVVSHADVGLQSRYSGGLVVEGLLFLL